MVEYTIPSRGIVAYSKDDWKLENLLTREPYEDEMLVEMIATGMCHTDILGFGGIYPRVLGHEGAGRVLRTGSKSTKSKFKKGDLVILSAAACLSCHYCTSNHPAYCTSHSALTSQANDPTFILASSSSNQQPTIIGGSFFGQSSFASPSPVKISCAANVTTLINSSQELRKFAPLGCGIMTGAGTITHVSKSGPGDVVAVIGLGGVGLAAICAAKHAGVTEIIAVDLVSSRIELAREMGASKGVLSPPEGLGGRGLGEVLKEVTSEGLGCSHILDTTPSVSILGECLEGLRKNGAVFLLGIKPVGAKLEVDCMDLLVNGRRLVGVIEGDRDPVEALPELVEGVKEGWLPVERMLKEFPLEDFGLARREMEDGRTIKSVLVW